MNLHEKINNQSSSVLTMKDFAYAINGDDSYVLKVRPVWSDLFGKCPKNINFTEHNYDMSSSGFISQLQNINSIGANIFFIPNKSKELKVGAFVGDKDILEIRSLLLDHDGYKDGFASHYIWGSDVLECLKEDSGANIIVETSPGKYQAHFLVTDAPPPSSFSTLCAMMRNRYKNKIVFDKQVSNPSRPMRMPGFKNMKYFDTPLSEVVYKSDNHLRRYSFKSINDLKILLGVEGRNDLATKLSGYPDGWPIWNWINDKSNTPVSDSEFEAIRRMFEKHKEKNQKNKIISPPDLCFVVSSKSIFDLKRGSLLDEKSACFIHGSAIIAAMKDHNNLERNIKERLVFRPDNHFNPETDINLYKDTRIKSDSTQDYGWFIALLDYLFKPEDRRIVEKFMASVICYPEKKMEWGLLVRGRAEGTGKTSLFEIMRGIINDEKFVATADSSNLRSQFNCFLESKLLVYFGEVMLEGRGDIYNKMKEMFTAKTINIERKHMDIYSIDNFCKFYFTSNHDRPLSLHGDSRRIAIIKTRDHIGTLFSEQEFDSYMKNNLGGVRYYLETIDMSDCNFKRAPDTPEKKRLIASSAPNWETEVHEFVEDVIESGDVYCFPKIISDRLSSKSYKAPKQTVINNFLEEFYNMENLCSELNTEKWPRIRYRDTKYPVFLVKPKDYPHKRNCNDDNRNEAKELLNKKLIQKFS